MSSGIHSSGTSSIPFADTPIRKSSRVIRRLIYRCWSIKSSIKPHISPDPVIAHALTYGVLLWLYGVSMRFRMCPHGER